jgi:hypothetical protein
MIPAKIRIRDLNWKTEGKNWKLPPHKSKRDILTARHINVQSGRWWNLYLEIENE